MIKIQDKDYLFREDQDILYNAKEVAKILGISVITLRKFVYSKKEGFPQPRKISCRLLRWSKRSIDDYMTRLAEEAEQPNTGITA